VSADKTPSKSPVIIETADLILLSLSHSSEGLVLSKRLGVEKKGQEEKKRVER